MNGQSRDWPFLFGGKTLVLERIEGGTYDGPVINNRYKWVEFSTEDDQVIRAKVRTSLLNDEIEILASADLNGDQKELWEAIYHYVEEWNIVILNEEDGHYYRVQPPKVGGPESFKYAPRQLTLAIAGALIHEPFAKIDPKSKKPVESTEEQ
jgi:hypothetical protein